MRVANYIKTLRRDLVKVAEACGVEHPGLISTESVDILDGRTGSTPLQQGLRVPAGHGPSVGGRPRGDRPVDDGRRAAGRLGATVPVRRRLTGSQSWAVSTGRTCVLQIVHRQTPMHMHPPDREGPHA